MACIILGVVHSAFELSTSTMALDEAFLRVLGVSMATMKVSYMPEIMSGVGD